MKKIYIFLLAITCLGTAQATIQYTYVAQGFSDSTRFYNLDGIGGNDFSFSYTIGSGATIHCQGNQSYFAGDIVMLRPLGYDYGDSLGTFAWIDSSGTLANLYEKEQYVMVKLDDGNTAHYGWFRINYAIDSLPAIVSMAFNDVADEEIAPGQGDPNPIQATSINEIEEGNYEFLISGNSILFSDCSAYDKVCFYNVSGQQLDEIAAPVEQQQYAISINGATIVAFYKNGRLATSAKQYIK